MAPKLRTLTIQLQKVERFRHPKLFLEQYATPADIAAPLLFSAYQLGDIEGKSVLDLGCGTGMLAIGAAMLGAASVVGMDSDPEALVVARENAERLRIRTHISFEEATVPEGVTGLYDTVVMNPPFGAHQGNRRADRPFLKAAINHADVVWAILNAGSREFLLTFLEGRATITDAYAGSFTIPHTFAHHTRERVDIPVEIIRFERI